MNLPITTGDFLKEREIIPARRSFRCLEINVACDSLSYCEVTAGENTFSQRG